MTTLEKLAEAAKQAHADLEAVKRSANAGKETEYRGWSSEEKEKFDGAFEAWKSADEAYNRAVRAEESKPPTVEERKSAGKPPLENATETDPEGRKFDAEDATVRFLQEGSHGIREEEKRDVDLAFSDNGHSIAQEVHLRPELRRRIQEKRAMSTGTATEGAEMVFDTFWPSLTEALLDFGGMLEVSNVIETATGADLHFPEQDDTGNAGALVAENAADTEQDIATAETVLQAFKYSSQVIRVSDELEQDHFANVSGWMGSSLGTRLGRALNNAATVGTGSSQPNGVMTAATDSTVNLSIGAGITRANILDIIHSVDPAYRRQGARHMFNDTTLKLIMAIVDGDSRPLYAVDARVGAPSMIEGYPFSTLR